MEIVRDREGFPVELDKVNAGIYRRIVQKLQARIRGEAPCDDGEADEYAQSLVYSNRGRNLSRVAQNLFVYASINGTNRWVLQFSANGSSRKISIGNVDKMTFAEACKARDRIMQEWRA